MHKRDNLYRRPTKALWVKIVLARSVVLGGYVLLNPMLVWAHDCSSPGDCMQTAGFNAAVSVVGGIVALGIIAALPNILAAAAVAGPLPGTKEWDVLHPGPQVPPVPPPDIGGGPVLTDRGQYTPWPDGPKQSDTPLQVSPEAEESARTPQVPAPGADGHPAPGPIESQQSGQVQLSPSQPPPLMASLTTADSDPTLISPPGPLDKTLSGQLDFGTGVLTEEAHLAALAQVGEKYDVVKEIANDTLSKAIPGEIEAPFSIYGAVQAGIDQFHDGTPSSPVFTGINVAGAAASSLLVNPVLGIWDSTLKFVGDETGTGDYLKTIEIQPTLNSAINAGVSLEEGILTRNTSPLIDFQNLANPPDGSVGKAGLIFQGSTEIGQYLANSAPERALGNAVEQYYSEQHSNTNVASTVANVALSILGL